MEGYRPEVMQFDELGALPMHMRLDQDELWRTSDGRELLLEDMDPDHLRNVLAMLVRNAESLKAAAEWAILLGPQPDGDMACDAFDAMSDEVFEATAPRWLNSKPLVIRLRAMVVADEAPVRAERARRARSMPIPAGAFRRKGERR